MNIVVCGAGKVGASLVVELIDSNNAITIIDPNQEVLESLNNSYDIQIIKGEVIDPVVLEKANLENCDLFIAVADEDSQNIVACLIAKECFQVKNCVARLRNGNFRSKEVLSKLPLDVVINPEKIISEYIENIIELPGASDLYNFDGGRIKLASCQQSNLSQLTGRSIADLRKILPANFDVRILAVYRDGKALKPEPSVLFLENDQVYLVGDKRSVEACINILHPEKKLDKRICIVGGGNIGLSIAQELEENFRIKIIEPSLQRCEYLVTQLLSSIVIRGSGADSQIMEEEEIGNMDTFIAVSNDDKTNILACLLAKKIGVKRTIAIVTDPAIFQMTDFTHSAVDVVVNTSQQTLNTIISRTRNLHLQQSHKIRDSLSECVELLVEAKHSKLVDKQIEEIILPDTVFIGVVVKDKSLIIAHNHIEVRAGDRLIMFFQDRDVINAIESYLF